jgi:hypothetical protein
MRVGCHLDTSLIFFVVSPFHMPAYHFIAYQCYVRRSCGFRWTAYSCAGSFLARILTTGTGKSRKLPRSVVGVVHDE